MNPKITLAIAACVGAAAFLAGRMQSPGKGTSSEDGAHAASRERSTSRRFGSMGDPSVAPMKRRPVKERATSRLYGTEEADARKMTREERLAVIAKGAQIYNSGNQMAVLLGAIQALQPDEMWEAADLIGRNQSRGNTQAAEIWVALWRHWGEVDPETCFARFRQRPETKSRDDVRNTMRGWLEKDPAAALEWARKPDLIPLEAGAAALAIAHAAEGDSEKFRAAIQALPEGLVRKETLKDLFDMEGLSGGKKSPAEIYDDLPADLKADGWRETLGRIHLSDPATAAAWLKEHAGQPGTDFRAAYPVVWEMASTDPAGTAQWAAGLDGVGARDHPLATTLNFWIEQDPAKAKQWLESRPDKPKWAEDYIRAMGQ